MTPWWLAAPQGKIYIYIYMTLIIHVVAPMFGMLKVSCQGSHSEMMLSACCSTCVCSFDGSVVSYSVLDQPRHRMYSDPKQNPERLAVGRIVLLERSQERLLQCNPPQAAH